MNILYLVATLVCSALLGYATLSLAKDAYDEADLLDLFHTLSRERLSKARFYMLCSLVPIYVFAQTFVYLVMEFV